MARSTSATVSDGAGRVRRREADDRGPADADPSLAGLADQPADHDRHLVGSLVAACRSSRASAAVFAERAEVAATSAEVATTSASSIG